MSREASLYNSTVSVIASSMTSFKKRSFDAFRHTEKMFWDIFHNTKKTALIFSRRIQKRLSALFHHSNTWSRMITGFSIFAEVANIGIVLEIVARWLPTFAVLASSGPIAYLMLIADPLIYCFRASIRLARLIGRHVFHIAFEEEKHATKKELKQQTIGDIASLVFFSLAITFFLGVVAPPVGITLAWVMGLMGLGVVGYFDYFLPEKRAKIHFQSVKNEKKHTPEEFAFLQKQYVKKRNAMRLYMALLFGLALLLICGSAAAFAPPLLVPILLVTSKVASIFLGAIACGRFLNWCFKPKEKHEYGLIMLSVHPELMLLDDLKTLLGNKPAYALWRGAIYHISSDGVCEYLPVIHGDADEPNAIFPNTPGKLQPASTDQLLELTYLTGHTRQENPVPLISDSVVDAAGGDSIASPLGEKPRAVGSLLPPTSVATALATHGQFSMQVFSEAASSSEPEARSHFMPV